MLRQGSNEAVLQHLEDFAAKLSRYVTMAKKNFAKASGGTNAYEEYLQWMHYAEGSAMLPLMLKLYTSRLPDQGEALQPRIHSEIDNHLGFMNRALTNSDWFVNNTFSAADIQLSFVPQVGKLMYGLDNFPHLDDFLTRIHARPAYQRAVERGGPYAYGS